MAAPDCLDVRHIPLFIAGSGPSAGGCRHLISTRAGVFRAIGSIPEAAHERGDRPELRDGDTGIGAVRPGDGGATAHRAITHVLDH